MTVRKARKMKSLLKHPRSLRRNKKLLRKNKILRKSITWTPMFNRLRTPRTCRSITNSRLLTILLRLRTISPILHPKGRERLDGGITRHLRTIPTLLRPHILLLVILQFHRAIITCHLLRMVIITLLHHIRDTAILHRPPVTDILLRNPIRDTNLRRNLLRTFLHPLLGQAPKRRNRVRTVLEPSPPRTKWKTKTLVWRKREMMPVPQPLA
jgi:hypothetical protein